MPRDLLSAYAGVQFSTPSQAWAWLDNNRNLTDAEKRRVSAWITGWEAEEGQKFRDRLTATADQITVIQRTNADKIEDGLRRTAEVEHGMSTGRIDSDAGLKEITVLARQHRECLAVAESLKESRERWERDADRSVDDHLAEQQRRFPSMADATRRTLTVRDIEGR